MVTFIKPDRQVGTPLVQCPSKIRAYATSGLPHIVTSRWDFWSVISQCRKQAAQGQQSLSIMSGFDRNRTCLCLHCWWIVVISLPISGASSRDQLSTPWRLAKLSFASPLPAPSIFSICCLGLDLWLTLCYGMAFPVTFIPLESPQTHPLPTH